MSQPGTFGTIEIPQRIYTFQDGSKQERTTQYEMDLQRQCDMELGDVAQPDYKFNEDEIIDELQKYIDSTYEGHYSKNKFQSMEFIVDCGHGGSFCLGNIIKYAQRYGKKDGKNRKDLLKIMHYAIIALSVLDMDDDI
jgi:hypothetical protein